MKIGIVALPIQEGKMKYNDEKMNKLVEKVKPAKVSSFSAEFLKDNLVPTDAIAVSKTNLLDLLIMDIEKCENRKERITDQIEIAVLDKCISTLESEVPLCDVPWSEQELVFIKTLAPLSMKPVVLCDASSPANEVITKTLHKASIVFFYTAGPKEVHAWPVPKGSDIVTCAGKIHTDFARGFIKADIAHYEDFMKCHNFNDCKKQGLVAVVDRDYIIQPDDIIEIRFNV